MPSNSKDTDNTVVITSSTHSTNIEGNRNMNVPIKDCNGDNIDDNEFDRSNTINESIYYSNNIARDVSHNTSRSSQHMQLISPTDHETSTHSHNHSSPRHILHNHNDNTSQSTLNNIRHSKTLPPSIRSVSYTHLTLPTI